MDSRRKTIIINREFQIRFSLVMLALSALLINGIFIYQILFPAEQGPAAASPFGWGMILAEVFVLAAVWYVYLRISYRIAGPVHVFARQISKLKEGDLTVQIDLRDRDYFRTEATLISSAVDGLRVKVDSLKDLSAQIQHAHASGGDLSELLGQLDSELQAVVTVPDEDQ